ncbi:pyridoxamine 5'-phosphate oxidase family protein [Actinocorallia libanotica]|uniref:Pyridoxamine 5'-phosphate oxidase N-terminal domain-containing protein n=1 Tax=Actinocorallia libanotica TaxID=46162 RepID=A0ABP4BTT5_9ACTN
MRAIATVKDLEAVVGRRLLPPLLKSITELDGHCRAFAELSSLGFLALVDADGRDRAAAVGGPPGFASITSATTVELALPDGLGAPHAASGAALLLLIPGVRETLRINGRLTAKEDGKVVLDVEEAFLHCAKCVIRSQLWTPAASEAPAPAPSSGDGPLAGREFLGLLARSPFAVIASRDASGAADLSPKGDPPGFIRVLDDRTIAIPDRPGNQRTDTFHNIVERPDVTVLAIVPGESRALEMSGTATVTDDRDLLASMQVKGKQPHAALLVRVARADLLHQEALTASDPWNPARPPADLDRLDLRRAWVDHVKQNKQSGLAAALVRKAANASLTDAGLRLDYKRNLY